ncbi:MAG: AsmA-like C-terminal domain-containing protein [Campylobacterales bacterium]
MAARKIISTTNRYFLYFFIAISLMLIAVFFTLINGVHLETIKVPNATIKGFYLKLDKKLILEIQSVQIKDSAITEDRSTKKSSMLFQNLKLLLDYFERIDIKKITYTEYEGSIYYNKGEFAFDTKDLSGTINFNIEGSIITAHIRSLLFREYGVNTFGTVVYRLDEDIVDFGGRFVISPDIVGSISLRSDLKTADIELTTQNFTSLEPLRDIIPLESDEARVWTFDKIKAKQIKVNSFKLHIADLDKPEDIKKDDIYLNFDALDVDIELQDSLPKGFAKNVNGLLKENDFLFMLNDASYANSKLYESKVLIGDIFTDGEAKLYLDIKTISKLDKDINNLLRSYGIKLPLIQKSGETDARFYMAMDFEEYNTDINGEFSIVNSEFLLNDFSFFSKEAEIELENSDIRFKNANFKIEDILDMVASGSMSTKEMKLEAVAKIKEFQIETKKTEIAEARDFSTPFSLSFNDSDVLLDIPKFKSSISFEDKANLITLNSLNALRDISPLVDKYECKDGRLSLRSSDFENYSFLGEIETTVLPFLKDGKKLKKLAFEGNITPNSLLIESKDGNFEANFDETNTIYVKNIDLNIDDRDKEADTTEDFNFELFGLNSNIFYNDKKLLATRYVAKTDDGVLRLELKYKDGEFEVKRDANLSVNVAGRDLNDEFVNSVLDTNITKGGSFYVSGDTQKDALVGIVDIDGTTLTNMATINNLLAFFNTIPSLATLKSPGFNENGYKIDKGVIEYTYKGDILRLDAIFLDGKSMNIAGNATIDTKKGTIYMPLEISIMKNLSSIIDAIPIVNYIVLGDDKSMSIGVEVKGDMKNPEISTSTIKDVATSPLNIIKRTLETPFRIFE